MVLHVNNERYTVYEDQLETFHKIVSEAESGDDAWDETIQFARQQDER